MARHVSRTLLVVDPGPLCEGLRAIMAAMPGVEHLGEVNDPDLALAMVLEKQPSLVVLDGNFGSGTACGLVKQIKGLDGTTRCLVLVEDAAQQREALAAGADSAPLKGYRAEQLFTSLEGLLRGTS